ncbi:MAG: ATP-binding cassette domain-containing protein [Oligoflexia bacterium]|nr:ATP-binding cassette domain-containing protein [Oligoflexia bacterium]
MYLGSDKIESANLRKIRKKIGYVIQDGGLFPHLTALDNLKIVAKEAGLTDAQIQARIDELCEITKLQINLLKLYPRQLSGGQRQRIGIMRALFLDPPVLLLDEPLGSLDPITKADLQQELKELITKLKKTVLLVTHDLFEAGLLCNQILLLNKGIIVQKGSMKELIDNPLNDFVKKFVGSQL